MALQKKSKSKTKKSGKKTSLEQESKSTSCEVESCSKSDCPQTTKQFLCQLMSVYANKYYILLLGSSVGFAVGVAVDHLFIKK